MDINPFASLLQNPTKISNLADNSNEIGQLLESIFEITLNDDYTNEKVLFFFGDLDQNEVQKYLSRDNLDEILLQRIMLNDKESLEERLRPIDKSNKVETNQFIYLFESYMRVNRLKSKFQELNSMELFNFIKNLIINMSRTLLSIFDQNDELSSKFIDLIFKYYMNGSSQSIDLIEQFYDNFIKLFDESTTSKEFFSNNQLDDSIKTLIDDESELSFLNNIFLILNKNFIHLNQCEEYSNEYVKYIEILKFITRSKLMKYLLIHNSFIDENDKSQNRGRKWQNMTLIGKILSANVLPLTQFKSHDGSILSEPVNQFRYFTHPTQMTRQDVEINEKNMHQAQTLIKSEINKFFYEHLIKSNSNVKIRNLWLKWVSLCMEDNKAKAQEWSNYGQNPMAMFLNNHNDLYASDGYFINILDLFLTYSMPFCSDKLENSNKLLKVNFNYANSLFKNKSLKLLDKETKLIPSSSDQSTLIDINESNFNMFITECYYLTNNLIRLAYLSLYQKIMKLNNELSRWQQTYQQLLNSGSNDQQMSRIKTMFESMTIEFMNLKTILIESDLIKKLSKFLFNSCSWLYFIAIKATPDNFQSNSFIKQLDKEDLLLKETNKFNLTLLESIPEFFISNIVEFLIFINRFKESLLPDLFLNNNNSIDSKDQPYYLNSFLSLTLTYMGRSDRLFNPHIRASIAEAIESLLPKKQTVQSFDYITRRHLAFEIFANNPCSSFISESLLNIFVSIEMTGQSVQFEQKFNYRRPMYELIDYLWNMPTLAENETQNKNQLHQHRAKMKELADYAYENIDNSEQPLFLKFLNYLINDANFLLLEGLLYLEKIKVSQDKLALDDIEKSFSSQQRSEIEANLKQMIMMAKFHNFMSLKTIQTIKMLTSEIKRIFCHDVLVDRVATMLNDFLLHLVGKKKRKQLKVKNFDEVEFKPKEVVSIICDIYLNLSEYRKFCEAVCRDGRSYSSDLFNSGVEVLEQINRDLTVIDNFKKLAQNVEEIAEQQRMDETNFEDAPDEYLDPIMSTLMNDPVILPNSKQIVDRSTIARHLLSDQTDPFNRSPLTLQDIIPAIDLKNEIEQWKASKMSK